MLHANSYVRTNLSPSLDVELDVAPRLNVAVVPTVSLISDCQNPQPVLLYQCSSLHES